MLSARELIVLRFAPVTAAFEGGLLLALERAEAGGALAVVEALYVGHDGEGQLEALSVAGGAGALVTALTDFRLDPGRRHRMTDEQATSAVRALANELAAGEALVAVVVDHRWRSDLVDAATRHGGELVTGEPVTADGRELADLTRAALRRGAGDPLSGRGS